MLIRFLGFSVETKGKLSLSDLINDLRIKSSTDHIKFGNFNRIFLIEDNKSCLYAKGLIITIKDHKRFCELREEEGRLKVFSRLVAEGSELMDFNFFLINKNTGYGLYQHYHNSFSINQFGLFLGDSYKRLVGIETQKAIESIREQDRTDKLRNEIKKKYAGTLDFSVLVRKENLATLLEGFETFSSFEYDYTTFTAEEDEFTPLSDDIARERKKLSFKRNTLASKVKDKLVVLVSKLSPDSGKIVGKDSLGLTKMIKLLDNPDNFGEYDYDDLVQSFDFDIGDFDKNHILELMKKAVEENDHIFNSESL